MSDLRRAAALMGNNQYADALPLLQSALRQSELRTDGPASAETAEILSKIAGCHYHHKNFRIAAGFFHRAAAISDYGFEERMVASLCAADAFRNTYEFSETENLLTSHSQ